MQTFVFLAVVFGVLAIVNCGSPEVACEAPRSPEHGQVFLYQEGRVVKYACELGFALAGKEIVRCINGQWEDPNPTCIEIGGKGIQEEPNKADEPAIPARPLFSWGSDNELTNEQEINGTDEEMALSDEARVRLLLYPRRQVVTRVANIQSATELEEEEKKRSQGKSPSVLYVRRTVTPGKSETAKASLHMSVENNDDVQLINVPRAAVDEKAQADDALRQLYWYYYHYPRHSSLVEYRHGAPAVMTLTESQLAWINSLHPELRDQYLKDLYVMRADETAVGDRVAYLRNYEDAYNYAYNFPYARRAVSLIVEDPISTYDYTCHESGHPFVKAPRLRNMHIHRYDKRQNPNNPQNHYLAAVYRCNPGYIMLDTRYTELYCSKKDWAGVRPVCVRRG